MADVLSQIPGLAGYLAMQNQQRQGAMQDLQGVAGLASLVQRQQQAQQEAQLAPLKMQVLQSQVGDMQRKSDAARALDTAIASLPADQQAIARLSPQAWAAAQMKKVDPKVVPSGGALVGGDGKPLFSNPRAEPKSSLEKLLDAAGITDPAMRRTAIEQAIRKQTTHAPSASNTVIMKQEGAEAKAVGEASGKAFNEIQQGGVDAGQKINRYGRLSQLLEGMNTGKLTPTTTQIAALADSIGIKIDPKLGAKQAVEALSNEIALTFRNPAGGAGMPGALSDKDREFLVSMTPGLAKTPEGNRMIIETGIKLAKRQQDIARLAREYRMKHGSFGPGFYEELQKFADANPLFPAAPAPQQSGGWSIQRKQ